MNVTLPSEDESLRQLRRLMRLPENQISLAEAALWIATFEYPQLDRSRYIARLDSLASPLAARVSGETDAKIIIAAINQRLFAEEGFRGNSEDYYDARNSYLNEVMDRRTGIPIMLSTIYLEVAARLNFPMAGVGLPGHFLVRHTYFDLFIDPFGQGNLLTEDQCAELMHLAVGRDIPFDRGLLDPSPKLRTVLRIVNNLRNVYAEARQFAKALRMTELSLGLVSDSAPDSAEIMTHDLRHKAALLMEMRRYSQALETLEQYLELAPEAEDAAVLRKTAVNLRRTLAQMN